MIPIRKKLNPLWWFGNEDDGWCGEKDKGMHWWFDKNCNSRCGFICAVKWFIRNPMHNFLFYVVGFADRTVLYKQMWPHHPKKTLFVLRRVKSSIIRLPYFSFRTKLVEGYIGWRDRGNLGMSLRKAKHG